MTYFTAWRIIKSKKIDNKETYSDKKLIEAIETMKGLKFVEETAQLFTDLMDEALQEGDAEFVIPVYNVEQKFVIIRGEIDESHDSTIAGYEYDS
jgi:hypothetical protein